MLIKTAFRLFIFDSSEMPEVIGELEGGSYYLVQFGRNSVQMQQCSDSSYGFPQTQVVKEMHVVSIDKVALEEWKGFKATDREGWQRRNQEALQLYRQGHDDGLIDMKITSKFDSGRKSWPKILNWCLCDLLGRFSANRSQGGSVAQTV